jgi:hypothetical protein
MNLSLRIGLSRVPSTATSRIPQWLAQRTLQHLQTIRTHELELYFHAGRFGHSLTLAQAQDGKRKEAMLAVRVVPA